MTLLGERVMPKVMMQNVPFKNTIQLQVMVQCGAFFEPDHATRPVIRNVACQAN